MNKPTEAQLAKARELVENPHRYPAVDEIDRIAEALRQAAADERKSTLHEVWYALKAKLGAGEPQQVLNSVIDDVSSRKSSIDGGW